MLNPWEILILTALFLGSVATSFVKGETYQETKTEAAQKVAVDKAVDDAKAEAAIDYGVAQQLALEQQKRDLLHAKTSRKLAVAITADKSAADCKLAPSTLSVLDSSIDAANGVTAGAPGASDNAVPAGGQAGRLIAGGSVVRAGLNRVDPLDVQSAAQATH